jgi:hypothetical protein
VEAVQEIEGQSHQGEKDSKPEHISSREGASAIPIRGLTGIEPLRIQFDAGPVLKTLRARLPELS